MNQESNAPPEAKKLDISPNAILERVMSGIDRKSSRQLSVRADLVERVARKMAECGYDFTNETLNFLADYLRGYNIWLCGAKGVGKTYFFECLSRARRSFGMEPLIILSAYKTQRWSVDDLDEWIEDTRDCDVVFDELGKEPLTLNNYGEKVELFPSILEERMKILRRRFHLTGNIAMTSKDPKTPSVRRNYGDRTADRFVQFFKMEEFNAKKSRRILSAWKSTENGIVL